MNDESKLKKLNYQLQQMAFQKYPFEINNKTFFCLQTYFQDQLLNGVDLQLFQAKGITAQPQKIAYLQQNQQIIMFIGSNIISYNAQKRAYSLITEVEGYVEILRTYSSKLSNKTYIYWLQSEKQGQNIKMSAKSNSRMHSNNSEGQRENKKRKITSILDFGKMIGGNKNARQDSIKETELQSIKETELQSAVLQVEQRQEQNKKVQKDQKPVPRQDKKVRIDAPQGQNQKQQEYDIQMKRFSICVYDYERKSFLHRENLQIHREQVISEIFIYTMTEKMVGFVINDPTEQRAKIFYRKIKLDEHPLNYKQTSRKLLQKKKLSYRNKKCQRFNVVSSIMQIPLLKYNGETDQYLFKDDSTVYSLQIYQLQHEIIVNHNNSNTNNNHTSKLQQHVSSNEFLHMKQQKDFKIEQIKKNKQSKRNSLQIDGFDIEQLSREIQNIAHKMKNTLYHEDQVKPKDKYSIKVTEEIQLLTEENIVDIALSEVYLVVLTQQFIRFYSIFNLNTLLFKHQLQNIQDFPTPTHIELNKSYLLITHQNSPLISSYTILERKLKYNSTCQVQIEHCQSILKVFMNSYNCQVAILARQCQIQGRITNLLKSKRVIASPNSYCKKTFLDISLAYINFSSTKCETHQLYLKNQRFRNILICKWHSQYLIQTQNQIVAKQWRESFENMRCSCIHPTGQYLIIGFADCFKIYAITHQGLQNTFMTDVLKDCQSITYSEYGDQFAIGSGNSIAIYGSYDCTKRYSLLLSVGSIVQNLQYRGYYLICTLKSKKVIVYHSQLNYKQVCSFNPKQYLNQNKHELSKKPGQSAQNLMALTIKRQISIEIYSLFYDLDLNVLIFSSGQKIFFLNTLTNESLGSFHFQPISTMEYNKHLATLFIGTFTGELIAFPWPNKPSNILSQLPKFKFHSSKIIEIKITSDFKYLITIGADMAIYTSFISYILNLKRLKGSQIAQYKSNKSNVAYCNFLNSKGICQFSHSQNQQKLQVKKQLQQQVVNTVFMLPEERMKQKQNLLQKLTITKEELNHQNTKEFQPLQQESVSLRNRIYKMKDLLQIIRRESNFNIQNQTKQYEEKTSSLLNKYSQMNYQSKMLKLQFQEDIQALKQQQLKQHQNLIKQNQKKQKQLLKELQLKQKQAQNQKNNFLELDLIDQEKQTYLQKQLQYFHQQLELVTSKNGQLTCKNSTIEKQIHILKYRIQELKFVIMNANQSISKLQGKQKQQKQQKLVFQNLLLQNAKINVSEMEKKYIKATKELIEKNKLIDINLSLYQKEKQILIKLQKTVEKTESQIDRIVDSFHQEKQFRIYLIQKCALTKERLKEITETKNNKQFKMKKGKTDLKKFVNDLHELEKQLQKCLQQNKRQRTTQTDQVIKKLKELEESGITREQQKQSQNKQQFGSEKSIRRNEQRRKTEMVQEEEVKRKEEKKKSNAYLQLMGNLKKSSSNLLKQKKGKKIRLSTEQKTMDFFNKDEFIKELSEKDNKKQAYKIDYKNKFQEQFGKYRKDKLLNNTITGNFRLSTQRQQSPSSKILQKTSSKYFKMKTEGNFKTQRFSNNKVASKNSPPKAVQMWSSTNRDSSIKNTSSNKCDDQIMMQRKKQTVIKKLSTEDKLVNKINGDKKLFMTSKNRLHQQNQDLLNTYNSLTHQNKYYQNLIKAYETQINEESHHYRLNNPHSHQSQRRFLSGISDSLNQQQKSSNKLNLTSSSRLHNMSHDKIKENNKKLTPFQQYIKNKQSRINHPKNNNHRQSQNNQNTKQQQQQQVPTLTKVNKPQTSQQKRVKTVPCVQFNF